MKHLKSYLDQLKNLEKDQVLSFLTNNKDLTPDEKNLIFLYLFPRDLLDKELPSRVQSVRPHQAGSIQPSLIESILLIEAGRTPQYNRFIKHLLHSFTKVEDIHCIEGSDIRECCVCGKEIYELTLWKNFSKQYRIEEETEKLFLAYGSTSSDLPICIPCLINLRKSLEILEDIDPSFLDWTLRK